jgi:hypothetical protein
MGLAMSVKPMSTFRSTVVALALAFGALAALSLSAAAAPEALQAQTSFPPRQAQTSFQARSLDTVSHTVARPTVAPPLVVEPPRAVGLSPAAQHFFAAVRTNFAQWDVDHDGVLTREEIEIDMQDPRIVGDDAAALAALKLGSTTYNQLQETRSFTRADIDAMERTLAEGRKLDRHFVGYYAAGLKKLAEQPRELFVKGTPRIDAIRQDFTTDCYFLSAAGALAQVNPQALVRLITRNRDGSFTVTFPRQPAVHVPMPTDSEIATYTISKDGLWLSVLEKAYAILRIRHEPQQTSTREPLDSVGFRTGSTSVVALFTGHRIRRILFPVHTHQPLDAGLIAQVRSEIGNALREHRAVTAANSHHAYAVVGYDAERDLVTVHNPYDRGGLEKWIEGGETVRRTADGFFVISTARFVANFHNILFDDGSYAGS